MIYALAFETTLAEIIVTLLVARIVALSDILNTSVAFIATQRLSNKRKTKRLALFLDRNEVKVMTIVAGLSNFKLSRHVIHFPLNYGLINLLGLVLRST
jgi:hypothetical protein